MDLAATRACHCLAARKHARTLTRRYEEALRPHGLRATQFSILAVLHVKGETRLSDLASIIGVERTTLTRSADLLEANGWLAVAPSDDGRERRLRLTTSGRKQIERAYPAWKRVQDAVDRESAARSATG